MADSCHRNTEIVCNCRSPFIIESDDPQKKIIDLAVTGTKNVLDSAVKAKGSVKRVVVTSSVAGRTLASKMRPFSMLLRN